MGARMVQLSKRHFARSSRAVAAATSARAAICFALSRSVVISSVENRRLAARCSAARYSISAFSLSLRAWAASGRFMFRS